jgi:copper(I)-binding protein
MNAFRAVCAAALLLAAPSLVACGGEELREQPETAAGRSGGMVVEAAWALPSLPPHTSCAAFLTLRNEGQIPDALVGVAVDAAAVAEMHTMAVGDDEVMRMREVERYAVAPGESHVLAPGGDHLMFEELAHPWLSGEEITLTLRFENAPELRLRIPVRPRR